jgi:hypothetical protein
LDEYPRIHGGGAEAWSTNTGHAEPYQNLFHKLKGAAKGHTKWSRGLFSRTNVLLHVALLVILQFDIAQESRSLSPDELELCANLKRRVISLAIVERARKKQRARIKM